MNKGSFILPFHCWRLMFTFLCLLCWVWSPVQCWIEMVIKRHYCLVPNLTRKAFSLEQLSKLLAAGFSYIPFIRLRKFLSIPIWWEISFLHKIKNKCWILDHVKHLWNIKEMIILFSVFSLGNDIYQFSNEKLI